MCGTKEVRHPLHDLNKEENSVLPVTSPTDGIGRRWNSLSDKNNRLMFAFSHRADLCLMLISIICQVIYLDTDELINAAANVKVCQTPSLLSPTADLSS